MNHDSRKSIVERTVSAGGLPVSQGSVTACESENGGTDVVLTVRHLLSRSPRDNTVYVVWIGHEGAATRLGTLTVDDKLEGTLRATTAHRRFLLTVTPEENADIAAPLHDPIFSADVERPE